MKSFYLLLSFLCLMGIIANAIVLATGAADETAINAIALFLCIPGCTFNLLSYLDAKDNTPTPQYKLEDE